MKKILLLILGCLMILACGSKEEKKETKTDTKSEGKSYKIGITQIVTHPSLYLVKDLFIY